MKSLLANRMSLINPFYVMELLERAKTLEQQGHDIIHMEIGEPDFKTPTSVIAAGIQHLQSANVKYTEAAGLRELRDKIAQFYLQRFQVSVTTEQIFITPGASGAFLLALAATLNPGDRLLMADPGYPCNRNFVRLFDADAELIPVGPENRYQLNAQLVEQHWSESAKGVLIASPSNPTGTLMDADAFREVIASVARKGGTVSSDEIYQGLVYGQPASTALQYSSDIFVINSFSKYFGMTGWRIGWLIVPPAFIPAIQKLAQNVFIASSTPAQYAALAAFDVENLQELESRRLELSIRRDFLYEQLLQLGFKIPVKPEGAFYIYADCSNFTDDSFRFAYELLEAEGVAVTPGKDFGDHLPHRYIRFAYTTSIERIAEAMQRLKNFIQRQEN